MHTFQIRIARWLYGDRESWKHRGLVFHRWVPNGRADQIQLPTIDDSAQLFVWIERRGYVEDNWIFYDNRRHEFDAAIMERQGDIEVGVLHGELTLGRISESDYKAVTSLAGLHHNDIEDGDYYVGLGKRVNKILYRALKSFTDLLRFTYGQYWLPDLEAWDSRKYSLGHYLRINYYPEWSDDSGGSWHLFQPSKGPIHLSVQIPSSEPYWDFLTDSDWEQIPQHLSTPYSVSTALKVLSLAHALRDERNYRHALIECVTALEIAIGAYLDNRLKHTPEMTMATQQLRGDSSLPLRLSAVALGVSASPRDIALTFKTIETRNAIVHESAAPPANAEELLNATFRVIGKLLPGQSPRFPHAFMHGTMMSPEAWDDSQKAHEAGTSDT